MLGSAVRFRRALIAGLLAGGAALAPAARADPPAPSDPPATPTPPASSSDLRNEFGLSKPAPQAASADCGDGHGAGCALATDPLDDATPYALSTWLPARALLRLPVGDATHEAVAPYALGASRDGAGVLFGGATGLDNRWTIDGAPADHVRTGGVDTRVPLAFLDGVWVAAGGFAARDRASVGGTIDARLVRGTAHHELAADAWLSIARAASPRPLAPGDYAVRTLSLDPWPGPQLTAQVVGTG